MHRLWSLVSLALITLALPGAAAPSSAQPPAQELVPFKLSYTGQNQPIYIATDPTTVSLPTTLKGQSDLFGEFTGVSLGTSQLGVDGKRLYVTVVGEWSMGNGDALSVQLIEIFGPQAPDRPAFEGVLIITNGKGHFLGARGSGFVKGTLKRDPVTNQGTFVTEVEGLITRPKP
jgi:hypothetical protein